MSYTLFKVGRVWHYDFQLGRRRFRKSTRQTAKEKADLVVKKAYQAAAMEARSEEAVPTLRELVTKWLEVHEPISSDGHLANVDTFGRLHLYHLADMPISAIRTEDVEKARAKHLKGHARTSANKWLRILRLLTLWAVRRDMIASASWRVRALKVQKRPRPTLPLSKTTEWLAEVDKAAEDRPWLALIVRMVLGLGLRISEAATARWEWIDSERAIYTPGITKGKEAEPVPIPDWLLSELEPVRKAKGLIACDELGQPIDQRAVRTVMHLANDACGLHGITPHRLRGTYATMLSESGVPIQDLKAVLRHKDWRTTMDYLEIDLQRTRAGVEKVAKKAGISVKNVAEKTREPA